VALWHDAYLFDPASCVSVLAPHIESLASSRANYAALRAAALRVYESSPKVRRLADSYGGWDLEGLMTQFPAEAATQDTDITFWLMLFVFEILEQHSEPLGLNGSWRVLDGALARCGWAKAEADLLIRGRPFDTLFERTQACDNLTLVRAVAGVPRSLRPESQSGWMGWTSKNDVERLKARLEETSECIKGSLRVSGNATGVYESSMMLLELAQKRGLGVCSIISG
jgi:hypothetical protein